MIGHLGGAPIEELLLPVLASSGAMLVIAAKVTFSRATKRGKPRRSVACANEAITLAGERNQQPNGGSSMTVDT